MRVMSLLLAGAVASAPLAAADQVYKWTDENGVTHYSDSPPENRQYETKNFSGDKRVAVEPDPQPITDPAAAATSGQDPAAIAAAAQAAREQNCATARANLDTLRNAATVRMDTDGDGTPEILDQAQRDAQAEIARGQVETYCDQG